MPPASSKLDTLARVQPADRAAWRAWLVAHHATSPGCWCVTFKQGAAGGVKLPYDALVEEALCVGWVDGLARGLDAERTMLLVTPRKPRSGWSAPNKARVARLTAAGLMLPAGLAKVEAAKADGSWTLLDGAEALAVPDDLAAAFARHPGAAARWDAFAPSARKAILAWIALARRPGTRLARVERTAELAARGLRANLDA